MFGSRNLIGNVSKQFDEAVEKVTNSILIRRNPFPTKTTDTLHNVTSRQLALPDVCQKLLSSFEHAQEGHIEFREQRLVTKSIKLSVLSKRNLSKLDTSPKKTKSVSSDIKAGNKELAFKGQTQRSNYVARSRRFNMEDILCYDHTRKSTLFKLKR